MGFKNIWRKYYFTLFSLLIGLIYLLFSCSNNLFNQSVCQSWLKDLSLNLVAELIGILMVLFLVNRSLEIQQEQEKSRFRKIACRQLKLVLNKQFYLLFNIFKAAIENKPEKNYQTIEDLFDNLYFEEVGFLDLLKTAPVLSSNGEEIDWLDYLFNELSSISSVVNKIVDRYCFYLDAEVVDLLEEFADADFISFVTVLREAKQCNQSYLRGDLLSECQPLLREYTILFVRVLNFYNHSVEERYKINIDANKWHQLWDNNLKPLTGGSRTKASFYE